MKTYRRKGSITVFFCLISVLFLSLLCTSIESARIQGTRAKAAAALDMGVFSLFGEYEDRLLDQYDLFALDGACGEGFYHTAKLELKLLDYMKYNLSPNTGILLRGFDLFPVKIKDAEITGVALLTDQKGQAFYQQAVSFMHDNLATEAVDLWLQRQEEAEQLQSAASEYQNSESANSRNLNTLSNQQKQEEQRQKEEREKAEKEALEQGIILEQEKEPEKLSASQNPLETIKKMKKQGILKLAVGNGKAISEKQMDSDVVSNRFRMSGTLTIEKKYSGLTSDLLFQEYLFERFSHFGESEGVSGMEYELEYILCGKKSEEKNLKAVVNKLLLLREGANFLYLCNDLDKRIQTEEMAALIVGAVPVPGLSTVVSYALMLVWAYAESLLDLRILMNGGKVPVWKNDRSWNMELADIPKILDILNGAEKSSSEGLTYEGYLQMLFTIGNKSAYPLRALDLIECDMKKHGNPGFRADQAIIKMQTKAEYTILPMFLRVSGAFLGTKKYTLEYQTTGTFSY